MNRKLIAVMLLALLVLMAGCKSKTENADATEMTETISAATEENTPTETLMPGLVENPFTDDYVQETEAPDADSKEATTAPTEAAKATEPAKDNGSADPTDAPEDTGEMTYEKYMSLSATAQSDYMNSFESVDAFFEWYNAAKEAHDAQNNDIEIGDGSFDLNDLENGNG